MKSLLEFLKALRSSSKKLFELVKPSAFKSIIFVNANKQV